MHAMIESHPTQLLLARSVKEAISNGMNSSMGSRATRERVLPLLGSADNISISHLSLRPGDVAIVRIPATRPMPG
jgi:hypothetical protein